MIVEPEAFIYPTMPPVASVSDTISPVLYECATSASDDTDLPAMPPVPYVATPLLDDSTFPLFAHLSTVPPQFSPTIPPTLYVPEISPRFVHSSIVPPLLYPAIPPALSLPVTLISAVQPVTFPSGSSCPTMPPQLLSPDFTVPSTVRSLTSPLRYPKNPARPEALSTLRSLIVCPLPSNTPAKYEALPLPIGVHSLVVSFISSVSTNVTPSKFSILLGFQLSVWFSFMRLANPSSSSSLEISYVSFRS